MHTASLPPSDRDEQMTEEEKNKALPPKNLHRIPGDVVNQATADLPDDQRSTIRKFHAFYDDSGMSLGELEAETGIDRTIVTQIFRGKYPAKLDNVVAKINSYFELKEKRASHKKLGHIQTNLSQRIWQVCSVALEFQKIAFIFGESQIGKSDALVQYATDHNHGSTIYASMPTGGKRMEFTEVLAEKLRISPRQRTGELRRRIIDAFDSRMLLIVDEAHQCMPENCYGTTRSLQTLEFIREIYDKSGCGLVICATNVFRDEMDRGQVGKLLAQIKLRRICTLQLPDSPTIEDLNTFSRAYGLGPAKGEAFKLQSRVIVEESLGRWLALLRMAAKVSKAKNAPMNWGHVESAHAGLLKMEGRSR